MLPFYTEYTFWNICDIFIVMLKKQLLYAESHTFLLSPHTYVWMRMCPFKKAVCVSWKYYPLLFRFVLRTVVLFNNLNSTPLETLWNSWSWNGSTISSWWRCSTSRSTSATSTCCSRPTTRSTTPPTTSTPSSRSTPYSFNKVTWLASFPMDYTGSFWPGKF